MSTLTYPAARTAATRLQPHLRSAIEIPTIEALINAAFWASLRREEGRTPRLSLAFVSPLEVSDPMLLGAPFALDPQPLTHISAAVERPGIHLGVWYDARELRVWGATRHLPPRCLVLEVIAPGLIVVKQSPADDSGKFVNVAVLQGDDVKIIDQLSSRVPDCPELLTSLLGFESQHSRTDSVNTLIQLAVSMRAHGRGGSLLVVPANSAEWLESVAHPITYAISPPFTALADLMQTDYEERSQRWWQDAHRRSVDGVAGLTAVDGATVITDRYELLAFGVKTVRRLKCPQIARVIVTEPVEGVAPEIIDPTQLGGTRHLSAAQFEQDQRDAVSLVASQDGRFTVFAWSPCEEMVHAHRIESLLL